MDSTQLPEISADSLARQYGTEPSKFLPLPGGTVAHYRDYRPSVAPVEATLVLLHGAMLWPIRNNWPDWS